MVIGGARHAFFIFLGDVAILVISILLALILRSLNLPSVLIVYKNVIGYLPVIFLWIVVYYIANLYSRQVVLFQRKLMVGLIQAQSINLLIAVVYFYLFQNYEISFGITPRVILLYDLIISTALIMIWRIVLLRTIFKFDSIKVLLIGDGKAVNKLLNIFNRFPEYKFTITRHIKENIPTEKLADLAKQFGLSSIILDTSEYIKSVSGGVGVVNLSFSGIRCIDADALCEELTNKIDLQKVNDSWVLEHISYRSHRVYTFAKRVMDIFIALPLTIISLIFYPFVILAIKLNDGGPIFFSQERVGKNGKLVNLWKFRTMTTMDMDKPTLLNDSRITRVGKLLRKTRIDEFPQLWNVLQGRVSLVGPRPELPHFVEQYTNEIPYYFVRHAVAPGLSGWAQILYNEPAYDVESTKEKLAYDLYYIKNRSLVLDFKIALKTIKTLLMRVGI